MIKEIPYALIISGIALAGLWMSNIFYDLKVPHYISRKIGHSAGGVGFFLFGFFFNSAFWPVVLTGFFTLLLGAARIFRPTTFGASAEPDEAKTSCLKSGLSASPSRLFSSVGCGSINPLSPFLAFFLWPGEIA